VKKIKLITISVLLVVTCNTLYAKSSFYTASNWRVLKAACPESWRSIDRALPSASTNPVPPTSIPWANQADKDDFKAFLQSYVIASTKNNQTLYNKLADPLLVASECAKRKNIAINAQFNKNVGIIPELKKLINPIPMLISLGFFDSGEQ